jgi:methionyl-tRNA formyltransferase
MREIGEDRVELVPDLERVAEEVKSRAPDLVVSWFWTRKIPRAFREIARLGAMGVHPSLLPRHRGPDPYFWALARGDETTGVTAHALDDEYDTGVILGSRSVRIDPSWNAWTLAKKLDRPSLGLLREIVRAYAAGGPPSGVVQDEALATTAPEPSEDDLEIRWSEDATHIERLVRAASPWPGAFTAIGDEVVVLTRVARTSRYPAELAPGQAFVRRDGIGIVRTRDAAVELYEGRDEDDRDLDAIALATRIARERDRD